jgi:ribonuclease T2
MVKSIFRAALAALVLAVAAPASAEDPRQNEPGQFDFYVLALSWSPSFCEAAAERGGSRNASAQCGARPYSFVVHGLWPQCTKGFPEYCQVPAPRLDRGIVSSMLDLMPAPHLIFNEWDRHGTCSGVSPRAYFETVRKARAVVKIPPDYIDLQAPLSVSPAAVGDAFIKANPGLTQDRHFCRLRQQEIDRGSVVPLKGVVQFHDCPEVARRSCRRDQVLMPPLRGGSS